MDGALPFSSTATLLLLGIAALGVLSCVVLLSRRKLTMSYTLTWIGAFVAFSALISVPHLLAQIGKMLATGTPDGALRLLAFATIVGFLIFFSVKISELTNRLEDLAQRVALLDHALRERIDRKMRGEERDEGPAGGA